MENDGCLDLSADTRGQDISHFRGQTFSISIDFATKAADKAAHPNIPRTPADLLHLPPICLALSGGSPFGTAKPCSTAICPELCIVRRRRQASKKHLRRNYLFFDLSHGSDSHMQVISHGHHIPQISKQKHTLLTKRSEKQCF